MVVASCGWDNNGTGYRLLNLYKNGASVKWSRVGATSNYQGQVLSVLLNLTAGDYLEIYAYQDSGGARTIYMDSNYGFGVSYQGA